MFGFRPRSQKGTSLAEYTTLAALMVAVAVVASIGFDEPERDHAGSLPKDFRLVRDRIDLNCMTRTRANDLVTLRQARPYNCFYLDHGKDRITVDHGMNVIHPGTGDDEVTVLADAGDTEVVYQGGNDVYRFFNKIGIIDLGDLRRSDFRLRVAENAEGDHVDLLIETRRGSIHIPDQFIRNSALMLTFADGRMGADQILLSALADWQTPRSDHILGSDRDDVISPDAGNDYVDAGAGNDLVIYRSGTDRYEAGIGRDIVQIDAPLEDLSFSISPNYADVMVQVRDRGQVILLGQAQHPPTSSEARFTELRYLGGSLDDAGILSKAISDQSSAGDDRIVGTIFSDRIYPGKGVNLIQPGPGSDHIFHEGGADTILPGDTASAEIDLLEVAAHPRSSIAFSRTEEDDLRLDMPDGGSIIVVGQFLNEPGSQLTNIEQFRFAGETMSDAEMRQIYFPSTTKISNPG